MAHQTTRNTALESEFQENALLQPRLVPLAMALMLTVALSHLTAACAADPDPARGYFVTYPAFHSKYLKLDRDIRVWLPPGYDSDRRRRYPVFYMHDGQNLYKGGPSFIPNQAWNADTIAADLIRSGRIQPLILVGI